MFSSPRLTIQTGRRKSFRRSIFAPAWSTVALLASCAFFSSAQAQSPFLKYSFDESGGSSVADSAGNNNGQLTGSATHPQAILERGISFAGTSNAYVTTANSIAANNSTGLTVNVWVRPTSFNSNEFTMIAQQMDGNGIGRTWLSIDPNGNLNSWIGGGGTNGSSLTMNEWQMVTVTAGSGQVRLYINGVQVGSSNRSVEANTAAFRFGNFKNVSNARQLRGALDELSIFSGALTANQINALYQSYLAPEDPDMDAIIQAGLAAWRKPDQHGASCADCHGMVGIDLAVFDFDGNGDTVRRALDHVNQQEAETIRDMIDALRTKYNITEMDKLNDRPFQPTGQMIAGSTDVARDNNFGAMMENWNILLFTDTIDSIAKAQAAAQQLYDLNMWEVPVGIPFNLLSTDAINGPDHGNLAEWIPTFPRTPKAGMEAAWFALHDAYIDDPSNANFWAIYHALDSHTEVPSIWVEEQWQRTSRGAEFDLERFKSMLLANHFWLLEAMGQEASFLDESKHVQWVDQAYQNQFNHVPPAIWDAADVARKIHGGTNDFWALNYQEGFPVREIEDMNTSMGKNNHMELIDTAWFYNGWLIDQGMMRTNRTNASRGLEYMNASMRRYQNQNIKAFYPLHNLLVIGKRNVVTRWDPDAWPNTIPSAKRNSLLWTPFFNLSMYTNASHYHNTQHFNRFNQAAANLHAMLLYIAQDDLNKGTYNQYYDSNPMNGQLDIVENNLNTIGAMTPALQQIINNLRALN